MTRNEIGFEPIRKIELVRQLKTHDGRTAIGAGETVVVQFDLDATVAVSTTDGRTVLASVRELQRPERPSERAMRLSDEAAAEPVTPADRDEVLHGLGDTDGSES